MIRNILSTSAIVLALSAPVMAVDALAQGTTSSPPAASPTTPGAPSTTAPRSSGGDQAVEKMKPDQMRASKLIGKTVYGPDDKSIGDVSDLIVEKDGKITQAVLSVGGFLGIGDKHVAVPMDELKIGSDERLSVAMTKDQLKAAPKYEYAEREATRPGTAGSSSPGAVAPGARPGAGTSTPPATGRAQ